MKSTCVSTSQRIVPPTPAVYQSAQGPQSRLEALPRREHPFEQVTVPPNALEHGVHGELLRVERLVDFLPAERRRDRRSRARAHRVDRGDRLPLAVLVRIDQNAAA